MSEPPSPRPKRPPWSEFKATLDVLGFRPSKRLGQNFLLDENLVRVIAQDAHIAPGEFVLEVGPGCGFLSVHLAHTGARLLCVEVDARLAQVARRFLEPYPNAELIEADVLAGKHALAQEVEQRLPTSGTWHLCSNLPYSVGGPLMALLAEREHPPDSMTVLVQKEVAGRLCAEPASAAWGPLSVALQSAFTARILRNVPAAAFWPRPQVQSSVVRLERRADLAPLVQRRRWIALARRLLQHRRQTLLRVLGDLLEDRPKAAELIERAGLDPGTRAETLPLESLATLSEAEELVRRLREDS